MNKKEKLSEFHRDNILTAASALFQENGVEKTTVDMICKHAEYSKATVYVYFKSKEEILDALVLESMKQLQEKIKSVIDQHLSSKQCFFAICNEIVAMRVNEPIYFERMIGNINVNIELEDTPKIYSEIFSKGEEIMVLLHQFIDSGIKKGDLKNVPIPQTIFLLWGSLTGLIRMTFQKEEYIYKSMGMKREKYLQYSFQQLSSLIIAGGNGYEKTN